MTPPKLNTLHSSFGESRTRNFANTDRHHRHMWRTGRSWLPPGSITTSKKLRCTLHAFVRTATYSVNGGVTARREAAMRLASPPSRCRSLVQTSDQLLDSACAGLSTIQTPRKVWFESA